MVVVLEGSTPVTEMKPDQPGTSWLVLLLIHLPNSHSMFHWSAVFSAAIPSGQVHRVMSYGGLFRVDTKQSGSWLVLWCSCKPCCIDLSTSGMGSVVSSNFSTSCSMMPCAVWMDGDAVFWSKLSKSEWNKDSPPGFLTLWLVSICEDSCTLIASAFSSSNENE